MSTLTLLFSPFNLLFFIIFVGFAIGKLRIKRISLGIAGILFAAILVGFLMNLHFQKTNEEIILSAQGTMKIFSKLGSGLFVSVIGLQTGFSLKKNSKESVLAFAIGSLMSISGVMIMLLISTFDKTIGHASLLGILCGALTSTPGLSSVCELLVNGSEEAVLGYGSSYLLGVILVVIFTQALSSREVEQLSHTHSLQEAKSKPYSELMLICVVVPLGNILGSIRIGALGICFGSTAATLMVGLLIGCIVHRLFLSYISSNRALNTMKGVGLALFFAGTGFSTGIQAPTFNIKAVLYGAVITVSAMLSGWIFCKAVSKKAKLHDEFIIAGGMTSSPAYGALNAGAVANAINDFSFAYFGASISLILALQFIIR